MFSQAIEWVSGAKPSEQKRVLFSFFAVLFLLLSYYMIKPLRDSQFLKEFDPNFLPFVYLVTPILSLILTRIFNFFYNRLSRSRLIILTYLWVIACKIIFLFYLPVGGRLSTIIFFFWASTYFLLAISVLWGCINTIFNSEQGERVFGFIAVGATIGNMIGSKVSYWIALSVFKDYALVIASIALGGALLFILMAFQGASSPVLDVELGEVQKEDTGAAVKKQNVFADLAALFKIKYVRGIAVMVFVLALFVTVFDFQSKQVFDQSLAHHAFSTQFEWLETEYHIPKEVGFDFVYTLKKQGNQQAQEKALTSFSLNRKMTMDPERFFKSYAEYKDQHEIEMRSLFSNLYFYQGILGIILLLVVTRFLFKYMGLKISVLILPCFLIGVGVALYFPLELMMFEVIFVFNGALNYSLNNATKELLYTPTSDETKFKFKPLIEGPIMRFGDVLASFIKLFCAVGLVSWFAITPQQSDWIILSVTLLLVCYWIYAIWYTGKAYDLKKADEDHA